MRRLLVALALASVAPRLAAQAPAAEPTSLGEALQRAAQASRAGDRETARRMLRAADALAPTNPFVLYDLARAEARAGDDERALQALERLATLGAARDVATDSAFARLQALPRFGAAAQRIAASAAPLVRSDTAFALGDPDLVPEGIAYDPVDDAFYVGALHRRAVLRVRRDGTRRAFAAPGADGLGQVLGLRVDAPRRRLWLATLVPDSAAPRFRRGMGGWAFLHAYDLRTGRLVARFAAPDSTRPQLLNDIAVTSDGEVWVTDSEGDALHRLRAGARRLERVHGGDGFAYPNGLALSPDGTQLHVAHWEGLSVVALRGAAAGTVRRVAVAPGVADGGIDGMYRCGRGLLAVQSQLGFQQVALLAISPDGARATATRVLERRHPAHGVATTGAIAGDSFYYIANAPLDRMLPEGGLAPATAANEPVILRLPLGGACGAR